MSEQTAAKVTEVMKSAAHVARISLVHQRINVASMEPRGGTASYDAASDSYTLRVCSQGARILRDEALYDIANQAPTTTEQLSELRLAVATERQRHEGLRSQDRKSVV